MVSAALGIAGALLLPAAASAATFTVDGAYAPGCNGTQCKTISDAVTAAGAGDTINVNPGAYAENVTVPAGKDRLTIAGVGSGQATVTGAFKVQSSGVTLASLLLQRLDGADAPVLEAAGAAAPPTTVSKSVVTQQSGGAGSPGILVSGAGGVNVTDSSVISSRGAALRMTKGSAQITRSTLGAFADASNGLEATSASDDSSAKTIAIDSSIISGGASAAGISLASATGGALGSSAGPINLTATHLTTAGNANGIVLDAQANAPAAPVGSGAAAGVITASVKSSIVHGANRTTQFAGDALHVASSATLSLSDTDTDTPDSRLFVNAGARDFHLRADAPVIDTVGAPGPGESDRDVDGGPRVVTGNAFGGKNLADKGADEFSNQAPTARLSSPNPVARERVGIPFDASASTDPEAGIGGGVAAYFFTFGDGTSEAGASPRALHAYGAKGAYSARVSVIDAQGGLSEPSAAVPVVVTDGTAPTAAILSPSNGKKIKAGRAIPIAGQAADESGVQSVEVSVRYAGTRKPAKKKRKHRKRHKRGRAAATSSQSCQFVTPSSKLAKGSCTSLPFYPARVADVNWTFPIKKRNRLPKGTYEIRVRATDIAGNPSDAPSAAARTLVTFKIV